MTPPPAAKRRPRSTAPTMRDVARLAGVSQTAVSFVLNRRDDMAISEQTRARVRRAIDELGYRPNAIAQGLRSGHSNLIGFVTDSIATTPFAVDIVRGAQDAAWARGRMLMLVNTERRPEVESDAVAALVQHQADGVLFATMYHREIELPMRLGGLPVVLIDCYSADPALPAAVPDEEQGGHTATSHLIAHGHRRIGFVNDPEGLPAGLGRLAGYRRALREAGLPGCEDIVLVRPGTAEGGYDAALQLLVREDRPSALFCFNDRMAMGVYAAAQSLGRRIPGDLSVVGFDNQELIAAHLRPGLTTVALPHYEMGRWGVEALLGSITPTGTVRLRCPLVERASVAVPR